eukprot:gb/GECH01003752.1/.p1 GENE.gb/GECH01003752.1/~~gb/GECH01003752.1/.p1  ORF type:complete len:290 (+),score=60.79 gb/GECH01003752.1/:1-870(+)
MKSFSSLLFNFLIIIFIVSHVYGWNDDIRTSPMVAGHRGFPAVAPENTMPSFLAAIDAGADGIETDLHVTQDNIIVLIHDDTLNRTTNCTGFVHDYTFAELSSCDAGSWFDPKFRGTPIPTFEDLIRVAQVYNKFIIMDLKNAALIGKQIHDVVSKYSFGDRVIASCWREDQVSDIRRYMNATVSQKLSSTLNWSPNDPSFFANLIEGGIRGFSLKRTSFDRLFLRQSHQRLLPVYAWTVDDVKDIITFSEEHVNGLITNEVGRTIRVLDILRRRQKEIAQEILDGFEY